MARPFEVAGIDAYRRGRQPRWVAVVLRGPRVADVVTEVALSALMKQLADVKVAGIDMPLLLPPSGVRDCDLEARTFVGPRRSSVFLAPPIRVFRAHTPEKASDICREMTGRGLSRQTWGLGPRTLDLQKVAKTDERLIEVHPEVSFREMAGEVLEDPKLTWNGQLRRLELLRGEGIELPPHLGDAADVPPADLIDAAAAAWSARRVARGTAKPFPKDYVGGKQPVIWR